MMRRAELPSHRSCLCSVGRVVLASNRLSCYLSTQPSARPRAASPASSSHTRDHHAAEMEALPTAKRRAAGMGLHNAADTLGKRVVLGLGLGSEE